MSSFRLPAGGRIDRGQPIRFTFDGRTLTGFAGDSLAAALLGASVGVAARSFKYHRPRSIIAAGVDEPNVLVQLGRGARSTPNIKATTVELYDGLEARSVNAWPSAGFDLMAAVSLLARFMPAGFYYKTFMWPDWRVFKPVIRRAAGLGRSPDLPDCDTYDRRYRECDVLVVGGGPVGLVAAHNAARTGARVILVENDHLFGGSLLSCPTAIDGADGAAWATRFADDLARLPNVTVLNRTMAFGYYDHDLVGLITRVNDHVPEPERVGPRQRMTKVRARSVVLATGAFERPIAFSNNDRPGVMLAGAAATYVHRYGVSPGKRLLVATNNDSAYAVAASLREAGVGIIGIVDSRTQPSVHALELAVQAGVDVHINRTLTDVRGARRVVGAETHELDAQGRPIAGTGVVVDCDGALVSGGWSPAVHLFSQSGGKLWFDAELQAFVPGYSAQSTVSAGAAAGIFDLPAALDDAARKTAEVLGSLGFAPIAPDVPVADSFPYGNVRPLWHADARALGRRGDKAWLDFQNDVTVADVQLAVRENYRSVEHVKRYTTLGMASDQGKTSNVNAIGVMAEEQARSIADIGTTTFRPPFEPFPIGALAGRNVGSFLKPRHLLAAHHSHLGLNAKMEDYGNWQRPAYYPRVGESEADCLAREAKAVRDSVGLFDASPLGKIEVRGPDAAEFLNRMYVNNLKTLKPGRCRYAIMLTENGVVFDDGVVACLDVDHFLVGTTSGHSSTVAERFQEWLQCEWPELEVVTQDVTTAWAVMNINGPRSRDVLQSFASTIDFQAAAFPHMHVRQGMLEGVQCRVQRVSFSGELSYEIAVPWGYGASLHAALMTAGEPYGITPFGAETMMVLRIEKGFVHVGSDTDGMTLPQDLGLGAVIDKKKDDFIGRRSTMRPAAARPDQRHFIGLDVIDGGEPLPLGGHVIAPGQVSAQISQGWISSTAWSPNLGRPVALGLVVNGRDRIGERVDIWNKGQRRQARIVKPGPFDPEGERQNA
jgi:sarcosine oxidase, subunit alpha